ncbi:hypothetical protein CHUAL_012323 [Chamberlinius hualienensis]
MNEKNELIAHLVEQNNDKFYQKCNKNDGQLAAISDQLNNFKSEFKSAVDTVSATRDLNELNSSVNGLMNDLLENIENKLGSLKTQFDIALSKNENKETRETKFYYKTTELENELKAVKIQLKTVIEENRYSLNIQYTLKISDIGKMMTMKSFEYDSDIFPLNGYQFSAKLKLEITDDSDGLCIKLAYNNGKHKGKPLLIKLIPRVTFVLKDQNGQDNDRIRTSSYPFSGVLCFDTYCYNRPLCRSQMDMSLDAMAPNCENIEKLSQMGDIKRARVENLVSILKESPNRLQKSVEHFQPVAVNGCKKRKLYQPQQHESAKYNSVQDLRIRAPEDNCVPEEWKLQMSEMQWQISTIQRKLFHLNNVQLLQSDGQYENAKNQNLFLNSLNRSMQNINGECISQADWDCLAQSLKTAMSILIDDWVQKYGKNIQQQSLENQCYKEPTTRLPTFPSPYHVPTSRPSTPNCPSPIDEDNGPISLVVSPKKRRVKVTDKMSIRTPNRISNLTDTLNDCNSTDSTTTAVTSAMPSVSPDSTPYNNDINDYYSNYDVSHAFSSTLTPLHLRKAKLMFFYARYPSSSVLKENFSDIKFNKNNTAQLVKWFSNFREFYYIQMEKYARQAINDGCKSPDEITVSINSEIYRVLSLHYNRNSHIKIPSNFRFVVEQTLKEFFVAISTEKNNNPSWKKVIYKVIARMDDNLPEFFKQPNFHEQLE